jgi:hypothetical protein
MAEGLEDAIGIIYLFNQLTKTCRASAKVCANGCNKAWGDFWTPLHAAVYRWHRECVQILINSGADVNMEYDAETAVDLAMQAGHEDIVKILRDVGGRSSEELEASVRRGK